jgi:broad specificity phosphatase PhoE
MPIVRLLPLAVLGACGSTPPPPPPTPTPPPTLCVVRHAEAYKNLQPTPDLPADQLDRLTPTGEAQAQAAAGPLAGAVFVWTSPAGRARQTAERLGLGPPVVDPDLRPLDGAWGWTERLGHWAAGRDPAPPGGESLAQGRDRAQAVLRRAAARVGPGERGVVVTHGDIAALIDVMF